MLVCDTLINYTTTTTTTVCGVHSSNINSKAFHNTQEVVNE